MTGQFARARLIHTSCPHRQGVNPDTANWRDTCHWSLVHAAAPDGAATSDVRIARADFAAQ
jgi:hypothetical protein